MLFATAAAPGYAPFSSRRCWAVLNACLGREQFSFPFSGADLASFPLQVIGAPQGAVSASPPCGPVFLSRSASWGRSSLCSNNLPPGRPGPWGGNGYRSWLACGSSALEGEVGPARERGARSFAHLSVPSGLSQQCG